MFFLVMFEFSCNRYKYQIPASSSAAPASVEMRMQQPASSTRPRRHLVYEEHQMVNSLSF